VLCIIYFSWLPGHVDDHHTEYMGVGAAVRLNADFDGVRFLNLSFCVGIGLELAYCRSDIAC